MKQVIFVGMAVGSFVGSYIPSLWGAGIFSFSSVIFGAVGGLVGIFIAYRISNY
ncbi:MAG: hypothetical protein AB203_01960 [Parcubacteria bacterium C7867-008]|nr:MAG: hypothetical protein AB203_01960 [Parcubacteria bacterium C7867-008]